MTVEYTNILGVRWHKGGSHPAEGMDCWGVTEWLYRQAGLDVPSPCVETWDEVASLDDIEELDCILSEKPDREGGSSVKHVCTVIDVRARIALSAYKDQGVKVVPVYSIQNVIGIYRRRES